MIKNNMREIKFRAWDGKKMSLPFGFENLYGYEGECNAVNVEPTKDYDSHFTLVSHDSEARDGAIGLLYPQVKGANGIEKNIILVEYTGLKDKNGKEVFEGDVVKNKNLSMHGIVEFGECANSLGKYQGFYIKRFFKFGKTKINNWENPHWEIIGNIYENPELLK